MDLNARVDVNVFRVNVNFQTFTVILFRYSVYFILISINSTVVLIFHTKFQPNIPCRSGKNDYFISFAIFNNGGHLEFSIRLNFTVLKCWNLIMLHMKSEIHGCSD